MQLQESKLDKRKDQAMRKITRGTLVATAALASAAGITATSASATAQASWTISPVGNFTAHAVQPTLDVPAAQLVCQTSDATGNVPSGTSADGVGIADITSLRFDSCQVAGIDFTVTTRGFPWKLDAQSFDAGTGVTSGILRGIDASIDNTAVGCHADFSGPGTSTGTVAGSYNNNTGTLTVRPFSDANGPGLIAKNAVCLGLINNGDAALFNGDYAVTPPFTITSP